MEKIFRSTELMMRFYALMEERRKTSPALLAPDYECARGLKHFAENQEHLALPLAKVVR